MIHEYAPPTPKEISAQLDELYHYIGREQHDLLSYLIRILATGRYERTPTGKEILLEYYEDRAPRKMEPVPSWKKADGKPETKTVQSFYNRGRSLVDGLRDSLATYYTQLTVQSGKRNVLIQIPKAHGYKPIIDWLSPPIVEGTSHLVSGNFARSFSVEHLGNSDEALRRLIELIPTASLIEDTTIRWDGKEHYTNDDRPDGVSTGPTIKDFSDALMRNEGIVFRSITGPIVDPAYAGAIKRAFQGRIGKRDKDGRLLVDCYRLPHAEPPPMMNFLFLYERESDGLPQQRRRVVFFGFGHQPMMGRVGAKDDTAVFYSEDRILVDHFRALFAALKLRCSPIAITDPSFTLSHVANDDVLATFKGFPKDQIKQRIAVCKRISVCVSQWPDLNSLRTDLVKVLEVKALADLPQIDVGLWDKGSRFFKWRAEEVTASPKELEDDLQANLTTLNSLQQRFPENVRIHTCQGHGAVSIFWIDDHIYFGVYWRSENASDGPHFLVEANSQTGKFLRRQFYAMMPEGVPKRQGDEDLG